MNKISNVLLIISIILMGYGLFKFIGERYTTVQIPKKIVQVSKTQQTRVSNVQTCDKADALTQFYCDKYAPFRYNFFKLYKRLGIKKGVVVTFKQPLYSKDRAAIIEFANANRDFLVHINAENLGSDARLLPPGFLTYITETEEGIMQTRMWGGGCIRWRIYGGTYYQRNT